jgi:hypothetical protein
MLAFMHIRKTGGLTMRAILRKNFGTKNCDCPINNVIQLEDWHWVKRCYPNLQSLQGHSVRIGAGLEQVFQKPRFFTIIRDPFKRSLSHYQHTMFHGSHNTPLKDWIGGISNELCQAICGEENSQHAIDVIEEHIGFMGITEHYNESMLLWRKWTGFPDLDLIYKPKNLARTSEAKEKLLADKEAVELIHTHNQEDQRLFDYVCNTIYPRQKSGYGDSLSTDLKEYEQNLVRGSNLSFQAILGTAKRHLIYKRGLRDWKEEQGTTGKRVA